MASAALQKRGKTRWAFTMPKPLIYMQLDNCYEHALARARQEYGEDSIRHIHYEVNPTKDLKAAAADTWTNFVNDYKYAINNARSVVIDTASELMEVRKLAEFGRTAQIQARDYGGFYADFRWMVNSGMRSEANVLLIHRLKDEWIANEKTGGYTMEGWRGVQFDSEIYVEHERNEDGVFLTHIKECTQDAVLMGATLSSADEDNDFPSLAVRVFPETERADWE